VILADTSVRIDHLRGAPEAAALQTLLEEAEVLVHPWVIGELALGHLGPKRTEFLASLRLQPPAPELTDEEALELLEARDLAGSGLGWVDLHLLGSALVAEAELWARDGRLERVAADCGVAWSPG